MTDNDNPRQIVEMQTNRAADLAALLHIEERRRENDVDRHTERGDITVSQIRDMVVCCLSDRSYHIRNGWVQVDLSRNEWGEVERVLRYQSEAPGAFDNDFAHQNAMGDIASDLRDFIVDYREAHELV